MIPSKYHNILSERKDTVLHKQKEIILANPK